MPEFTPVPPAFTGETLPMNDLAGPDLDITTCVFEDSPILAERPMYFLFAPRAL